MGRFEEEVACAPRTSLLSTSPGFPLADNFLSTVTVGNSENQTCLQSPRLRLQNEFCFGLGQHIAHSTLTRLSLLRTLRPLHDKLCLSFTPNCSNSPSRRSCYWNIYASLPPPVTSPRVKVRLNSPCKALALLLRNFAMPPRQMKFLILTRIPISL